MAIKYTKKYLLNSLSSVVLRALNQECLGAITHVRTSEKIAALTFDDGPHPVYTHKILDILAGYGSSATFFVVGGSALRHKDLLDRMIREGHEIGNHSCSHLSFIFLNSEQRQREIKLCDESIRPYRTHLFRPPFGHLNLRSRLDLLRGGKKIIAWNIIPGDWKGHPAETMFRTVAGRMSPGSIILLHDALQTFEDSRHIPRDETCRLLEMLLHKFGREYRLVTITELLARGEPVRVYRQTKPDRQWLSSQQSQAWW